MVGISLRLVFTADVTVSALAQLQRLYDESQVSALAAVAQSTGVSCAWWCAFVSSQALTTWPFKHRVYPGASNVTSSAILLLMHHILL